MSYGNHQGRDKGFRSAHPARYSPYFLLDICDYHLLHLSSYNCQHPRKFPGRYRIFLKYVDVRA